MDNQEIRATLDRYWEATMAQDLEKVHGFYYDDVVVEFPQSGECIRGEHYPARLLIISCQFVEMEISGLLK